MATKLWGIHGQNRNDFLDTQHPNVGLGWQKAGDMTGLTTKESIKDALIAGFGDNKSISSATGQNYRFICEAKVGDYLVYTKERVIHIGQFTSKAYYDASKENYSTVRDVKWLVHIPSKMISNGAYNEINSAMSFFAVKTNAEELFALINKNPVLDTEAYKRLKAASDITPETYDGSYILVPEIAKAYAGMDISKLDYKDIDAIYIAAIGTWKASFGLKKQKIKDAHLTDSKKIELCALVDKLESDTKLGAFANSAADETKHMGMFGTGFMTYRTSKGSNEEENDENVKKLLELYIYVAINSNEDRILKAVEKAFSAPIKGTKTGAASVVLHCLKPLIFPIINGNEGIGSTLYYELGVGLSQPKELDTFIANTKLLQEFRDDNFSFKNFRVMDIVARELQPDTEPTVIDVEVIDGYYTAQTGLTKEEWVEILKNEKAENPEVMKYLGFWYEHEGYEASCSEIAAKHGGHPNTYNGAITGLAQRISKARNLVVKDQNGDTSYWIIVMNGRYSVYADNKVFNWTLRDEICIALVELGEVEKAVEDEKLPPKEPYTKEDFLKEVFISSDDYETIKNLLERKMNIILQGAPGVGKTFMARRFAYSIMGEKDDSCIQMIQFHQSYSYEDFIFGYQPTDTNFKLMPGIFYKFCKLAEKNKGKRYFMIIDEINRGNLSKIFGELLMLIEADKREKCSITLSHTKESFTVPNNLYIIGMMNTADRSLAMIDYALRRRFSFIKLVAAFASPKFRDFIEGQGVSIELATKIIKRFKMLNEKIAEDKSLGEGFEIGHSYFCSKKMSPTEKRDDKWYEDIVTYDIKPLLEEYWFDDKAKVNQIVAGLLQ